MQLTEPDKIRLLGAQYGGQRKFAKRINVSPRTVNRWFANGDMPVGYVDLLRAIVHQTVPQP